MEIKMKEQEFWYGGCAAWGISMPLSAASGQTLQFSPNPTPNQGVPLLLSNKGRYLWLEGCEGVTARGGSLFCPDQAVLVDTEGNLKTAYEAASRSFFPASGKMPDEKLFTAPIFNTWIELTFYESQEAVLRYASGILDNGFAPGVLMIDDGWSEYYGNWTFHRGNFPNPEEMIRQLHRMGFQVMVWICPYITPDSIAFRETRKRDLLLKNQDGSPFLIDWWNGYSAGLDLKKPEACQWLRNQLLRLQAMGVDGFKLDGGDSIHYIGAFSGNTPVNPNEMCRMWTRFGAEYSCNEYRASWDGGNLPLLQRLCDKDHSWGDTGLGALLPDSLAQGITGHSYICPDMIGGGEYLNFAENSDRLDRELFLRHCAAACLLPSVQFSAAPWRILTEEQMQTIHAQLALRKKWLPYLMTVLRESAEQGTPSVRYLEYEFPGEGCEAITDQFMLGAWLLVSPVLEKGAMSRRLYVPKGTWSYNNKIIESAGESITLACDRTLVIVLKRIES